MCCRSVRRRRLRRRSALITTLISEVIMVMRVGGLEGSGASTVMATATGASTTTTATDITKNTDSADSVGVTESITTVLGEATGQSTNQSTRYLPHSVPEKSFHQGRPNFRINKCVSQGSCQLFWKVSCPETYTFSVPHLLVSLFLCCSGSNTPGELKALEGCLVSSKSPSQLQERVLVSL